MTRDAATAALADAATSGVLAPVDVHFAELLVRRGGLASPLAAIGAALCAKAVRLEHVCAVLDADGVELLWRGEDAEPAPGRPDPVRARGRARSRGRGGRGRAGGR